MNFRFFTSIIAVCLHKSTPVSAGLLDGWRWYDIFTIGTSRLYRDLREKAIRGNDCDIKCASDNNSEMTPESTYDSTSAQFQKLHIEVKENTGIRKFNEKDTLRGYLEDIGLFNTKDTSPVEKAEIQRLKKILQKEQHFDEIARRMMERNYARDFENDQEGLDRTIKSRLFLEKQRIVDQYYKATQEPSRAGADLRHFVYAVFHCLYKSLKIEERAAKKEKLEADDHKTHYYFFEMVEYADRRACELDNYNKAKLLYGEEELEELKNITLKFYNSDKKRKQVQEKTNAP